ncbi:hypothetical protein J2T09_005426 [Neorhizobium huautlense]|uniref:Uncharacterized protein n=1 Tax=Neorhizobium huautlense TaxID=67774 RepID=A0ABT9Q1N4_9HYPH|nr:hypothetical protein [Neorhizobium huautlense]MDP9840638.1 hypothetical protein [Neorhizobium huautlense]
MSDLYESFSREGNRRRAQGIKNGPHSIPSTAQRRCVACKHSAFNVDGPSSEWPVADK